MIVFNKTDVLTPDEQTKFWQEVLFLRAYGFMLIDGNDQNNFKKQVRKILEPDDIICLSGKAGVGKTTLINKLIPELSLRVCSVSAKTKLGRHTTTNNQLIIWDDYFIADTAGFMVFNLNFKPGHYANVLAKIVGTHSCHFHNCLHLGERRCALKMTLSRDNNGKKWYSLYLKLIKKVVFLN